MLLKLDFWLLRGSHKKFGVFGFFVYNVYANRYNSQKNNNNFNRVCKYPKNI